MTSDDDFKFILSANNKFSMNMMDTFSQKIIEKNVCLNFTWIWNN